MAAATTAMAFKPVDGMLGYQPIDETSTTQKHPLGTKVKGFDPYYGEAEFLYTKGVASTALGDLCIVDTWAGTTTRAVTSTGAKGICGVAMSANVASQYGWYMIQGSALVNATSGDVAGSAFLTSTAGTITSTAAAHAIVIGMIIVLREGNNAAYAGTGKAVAQLAYPYVGNLSISTI